MQHCGKPESASGCGEIRIDFLVRVTVSVLIYISPSKSMLSSGSPGKPPIVPTSAPPHTFLHEAHEVMNELKKYTGESLKTLHGISDKLAIGVQEIHSRWSREAHATQGIPALLAYTGEAFSGIDAYSLTETEWIRAREHVRIGSGVYGYSSAGEEILPYRCEMNLPIRVQNQRLPVFWRSRISQRIKEELRGDPLIHLASGEYSQVIDYKQINSPVVQCEFKEFRKGKAIFISAFGKRARGLMLRHLLGSTGEMPDAINTFSSEGYALDTKTSTEALRVFIR